MIEFPLKKETAATMPEEFIRQILAARMNAAYIAAGEDLTFGYKGMGNKELLIKYAEVCGYEIEIIQKVFYRNREISSTFVREEVEKGDMALVRGLLGRYYSFEGRVREGNRLGRKLGMPTLNLYPPGEKLLPPKGVYYSRVFCDNCMYPGITNIGKKPTVNEDDVVSVETYLYDFDGDLYGETICVELLSFHRAEQRFDSLEDLVGRLRLDLEEGRKYFIKYNKDH